MLTNGIIYPQYQMACVGEEHLYSKCSVSHDVYMMMLTVLLLSHLFCVVGSVLFRN